MRPVFCRMKDKTWAETAPDSSEAFRDGTHFPQSSERQAGSSKTGRTEDKRHVHSPTDSLTDIRTETKEKETRHTQRDWLRDRQSHRQIQTLNR